ncbi:MAG TPA: type II secretion system F family protein [Acidimicrobiales bacterium]
MTARRGVRAGVAAGLVVLAMVASAPMAIGAPTAAPAQSPLAIRKIDATNPSDVKVTFSYTGAPGDVPGLTLRENGHTLNTSAPVDLAKTATPLGVVLAVDLSGSMGDDGSLSAAKAGLSQLVAGLRPNDKVAVLGFDGDVTVTQPLTTDHAAATAAIEALAAPRNGQTALYDALRKSASLLQADPTLEPNVVLVSDGPDDSSTATVSGARTALEDSGAALFTVGLNHNQQLPQSVLSTLVGHAGGQLSVAPTAAQAPGSFQSVRNLLADQFQIIYRSPATQGQVAVALSVGSSTQDASYVSGSVAQGADAIQSFSAPKPFGPAWLRSPAGELAAFLLVGLAIGLAAFAFINLAVTQDEGLGAMLRPYSEGFSHPDDEDDDHGLAQTALLQRAVEITEDFAQKQGLLVKVEGLLERADLPLRAAEALFFYGAGVIVVGAGGLFLLGFVPGLVLMFFAGILPPATLSFLAGRRQKGFMKQLPDMLQLLAGSLRAGYSLMQGVEAVSQEVDEPMGKELRRVMTEARLGRDVEDALEGVAERMDSKDFGWAVMAISIQREVGGNLSELLMTVGDTMVERERLRREVAALTAEGKISAIVLGLLPVGLGAVMWGINPTYMHPLISTGPGQGALAAAITMALIGFAWMKKTINIQI